MADQVRCRAGLLLSSSKTKDIVDALVAQLTRDGDEIFTSDPRDIGRLADAVEHDVLVTTV